MSVINQMLQDLDRRSALGGGEAPSVAHHLKAVDPGHKGTWSQGPGGEWFWRLVAALLLAALAWVGWVAYQLQPRALATDQALRAAGQARSGPIVAVAAAPAPPATPVPLVEPVVQEAKTPEPAEPAPPPARAKRVAAKPLTELKGTVSKRDVTRTARDVADMHFRRAAQFLNQGRVSEAEAQLGQALKAYPAHVPARQAHVALLLEQRRLDAARDMLREAVAADPSHAPFVLMLARIHAEQHDYAGALQVMDSAGAAAQSAAFQNLRAVVLQRTGRHSEAAAAYQQALGSGPQSATAWMGLGISLEALGHRPEAAQAYRRALGAGTLAAEAKEYAEARVKALE